MFYHLSIAFLYAFWSISELPNEMLKCAMYLFLGYLDGASQFAQSCGGGGGDNSLPCGRKEDEDDRRLYYIP